MRALVLIAISLFAALPANADDGGLRISRPIANVFDQPEQPTMAMLEEPIFCPVLLCHSTCNHREGPCTLRTFHNLLSAVDTGCCKTDSHCSTGDACCSQ